MALMKTNGITECLETAAAAGPGLAANNDQAK